MPDITGAQLRAARALLNVTASEVANETKLGVATLRRAELIDGTTRLTPANADRLLTFFDQAGVRLIFDEGEAGGVGVRFKKERSR